MTKEEKQLLLKDLCARLPYRVIVDVSRVKEWRKLTLTPFILSNYYDEIEKIKPYLRPMSSMTEEEKIEYFESTDKDMDMLLDSLDSKFIIQYGCRTSYGVVPYYETDWLLEHHFDYRGLIEKGLAIAVTEENNPYKD